MSTAERLRAEGREQGREEGREEGREAGRLEGLALSLSKLLTRRFGPLPEAAVRRIEAADLATLDRWFDRVLSAPDLDAVFE